MGVKYVKDFSFPSSGGFHVQQYAKGGHVKRAMGGKVASPLSVAGPRPTTFIPAAPQTGGGKPAPERNMTSIPAAKPMTSSQKRAAERAANAKLDQEAVAAYNRAKARDAGPTLADFERRSNAAENMQKKALADAAAAPLKPGMLPRVAGASGMYAKGGKVAKVMREYKEGKLHSGSKKGPKVKSRDQAVAIALSEARRAGEKVAKKADGGSVSSGPKTRYTPLKGRRMARERAMEKWAEQRMRHAEKHAPGKSLDMYAKGGMAKHEDVAMDKAMMKKAVHKHEKAMHPGKPLTKLRRGGVPAYGSKAMYGGGKC